MNRKALVIVFLVCFLSGLFYVGEFVTGQLHFITKCDPPNELDCPNKDFKGISLKGADLHGANFQGADLSDADLSMTVLYDANMVGAKLIGTNLYGANIRFVSFGNADLSGANMRDASIISSDLSNANLSNANLSNADLSGADLSFADFSGAILLVTKFENSIFDKTIWIDGSLKMESPFRSAKQDNSNTKKADTKKAESLICRDGYSLNYCQVRWSDGSGSIIIPYGLRQGGVVDSIVYYDLYGVESCISLYADGSISASYEMSRCL